MYSWNTQFEDYSQKTARLQAVLHMIETMDRSTCSRPNQLFLQPVELLVAGRFVPALGNIPAKVTL